MAVEALLLGEEHRENLVLTFGERKKTTGWFDTTLWMFRVSDDEHLNKYFDSVTLKQSEEVIQLSINGCINSNNGKT